MSTDVSLPQDTSAAYQTLLDRCGPTILIDWVNDVVRPDAPFAPLILVGVRDELAFRQLIGRFPQAVRIAVTALPDCRFMRDQAKSTIIAKMSRTAFDQRDALHSGWGIDSLIREANAVLDNNGTPAQLVDQLNVIAALLGGSTK